MELKTNEFYLMFPLLDFLIKVLQIVSSKVLLKYDLPKRVHLDVM